MSGTDRVEGGLSGPLHAVALDIGLSHRTPAALDFCASSREPMPNDLLADPWLISLDHFVSL